MFLKACIFKHYPGSGIVWGILEYVTLLEESCHCGIVLEKLSFHCIFPSPCFVRDYEHVNSQLPPPAAMIPAFCNIFPFFHMDFLPSETVSLKSYINCHVHAALSQQQNIKLYDDGSVPFFLYLPFIFSFFFISSQ